MPVIATYPSLPQQQGTKRVMRSGMVPRYATNGEVRMRRTSSIASRDPVLVHEKITLSELQDLMQFETDNRLAPYFVVPYIAENLEIQCIFAEKPFSVQIADTTPVLFNVTTNLIQVGSVFPGGSDLPGAGTVNSVSFDDGNGFDGSVANPTTTPSVAVGLALEPSITPSNNRDLAIEGTADDTITLKYKGSDGTVRSYVMALSVSAAGTVNFVSVASVNGISGHVTAPTTTPDIALTFTPEVSATLDSNGDMAIEAPSDSVLNFKLKGIDGIVRVFSFPLS